MVGCRLTRLGRRRRTFSGVVTTVLAVLWWISASPGLVQVAVCSRGSVGQVCGDAEVHWQHHDTVLYFSDRGHVGDPSVNTPAEAECVCRRSWLCYSCDAASFAAAGTAVAEQEASEGQSRWGRQPQKVADGALRRRQQLRLHMGMRHPSRCATDGGDAAARIGSDARDVSGTSTCCR